MNNITTGGPAFPTEHTDTSGLFDGMTLRDYFAAKVIELCLKNCSTIERASEEAYKVADAMLRAREQL